MNTAFRVESLSWEQANRNILENLSFELKQGEFVALIGPNGAGKSSLLRCLAGLHADYSGQIRMTEAEITSLSDTDRAKSLAYLEQNPHCHWPMTVRDVVALGRLPHRLSGNRMTVECRQNVEHAIEDTGLSGLADRRVDQLSGGEQRRVLLARTLATQAGILLADEPTAGLDTAQQLRMMNLLQSRAEKGMLVVIVLHDLALAARYCGRMLLLSTGQLVADGAPGEVLTESQLRQTYGIDARIDQSHGLPVIVPLAALD